MKWGIEEEAALPGRRRRARGGGVRPWLLRGERCRCMVATWRASPDAVRTWRGDGHGAREKKARRAEAGRAGAARGFAGPACGAGPKARRRPAKTEKLFFIYIFKNFLKASFQILF